MNVSRVSSLVLYLVLAQRRTKGKGSLKESSEWVGIELEFQKREGGRV